MLFRSAKEQELESQLQQTEDALSKLQTAAPKSGEIITADMANKIDQFQKEKVRIRKELRAVQAGLDADIKALGMRIKVVNVLLVPALCAVLALLVSAWHRRRRHAIAMLRKNP